MRELLPHDFSPVSAKIILAESSLEGHMEKLSEEEKYQRKTALLKRALRAADEMDKADAKRGECLSEAEVSEDTLPSI